MSRAKSKTKKINIKTTEKNEETEEKPVKQNTKSIFSKKSKKGDLETINKSIEFKKEDYIVYPAQGVGKIVNVEQLKVLGEKKIYYVIQILGSNLTIKIPVDKVIQKGIRHIIGKNDVKKVLKILEQEQDEMEEDWKVRYQNNLNKIKSGSIYEIAQVCRNLYKRARDKELSLMERKLYETTFSLIATEISIAKEISQEEANNLVSEILSKQ